jgi:DNA-directed RNA polymerase III subunit RPC2
MIVFKAMGFESDQDVIQMVGAEEGTLVTMAPSLEECQALNIRTQAQVK